MKHKIMITEKDGKRKYAGMYDDELNEFVTYRNKKKHLLRKYNAWSLDKKLVEEVLQPNNAIINIVAKSSKEKFEITTEEFIKHSGEVEFHQHRKQLYVNIERFKRIRL